MELYKDKIGCLVHIPNVGRGKLKYLGPVQGKPGVYAGVDLLANIGKNNGSFENHKYFETEYPYSGLFVQLEKLIPLIETGQKYESRRNTLVIEQSTLDKEYLSEGHTSSSGSTGTTVVRPLTTSNQQSPTPIKDLPISFSDEQTDTHYQPTSPHMKKLKARISPEYNDNDGNISMSANSLKVVAPTTTETPLLKNLREKELRLEMQEKEISKFKKLLNDQRLVLEELQPTIEEYEKNMSLMELENERLRHQLNKQKEQQQKQKQFFENEYEQLLAVVEELHQQMKSNERYFKNNPHKATGDILRAGSEILP